MENRTSRTREQKSVAWSHSIDKADKSAEIYHECKCKMIFLILTRSPGNQERSDQVCWNQVETGFCQLRCVKFVCILEVWKWGMKYVVAFLNFYLHWQSKFLTKTLYKAIWMELTQAWKYLKWFVLKRRRII